MTREIKFRGWDKGQKHWVHPIHCVIRLEGEIIDPVRDNQVVNAEYVLMQYTGLLDKNGVEIYEGDVIRIANYDTDWKHGEPDFDWRVFEVWYNRYTWATRNAAIGAPLTDYSLRTLEAYDIEVIGNIYENPNLLTREDGDV